MSEPNSESFSDSSSGAGSSKNQHGTPNQRLIAPEFALESRKLLDQSMGKIQHCLGQLDEEQIWWRPNDVLNSIGNLILHIGGNLRQWAVSGVGSQPDTRHRQAEFDHREIIPCIELLAQLSATVEEAKNVINEIQQDEWISRVTIQGFDVSKLEAISHTCTHFVGHTHQIIMLTRMQLGSNYQFQWSPQADRQNLPI